jgi:hypothetical protein
MKYFYYYLRDEDKKPVVTVCLGYENGEHARGVAICSLEDSPNKKVGRRIARAKMLKAFGRKRTDDPCLRYECYAALDQLSRPNPELNQVAGYKSAYVPTLTDFEKKLIVSNTT